MVDASLDSVTPVRSSVRRVIESLDNIDTRSNNERALRDEVSKLTVEHCICNFSQFYCISHPGIFEFSQGISCSFGYWGSFETNCD